MFSKQNKNSFIKKYFVDMNLGGRISCILQLTVANYAATHGATAAAKKFGIPPSVAAYYHRKVLKRHLPKGRRPSLTGSVCLYIIIVNHNSN